MRRLFFVRKVLSRTLAIILVTFNLTGAASSQATVVNTKQSIQFEQPIFIPCANGGAGELVEIVGTLHVHVHLTTNGNRVNGKLHFQPQGASGVGMVTGDVYRATGVTHEDTVPLTDGPDNITLINIFSFIGPGPDNNFRVHQNIHLTINANGEVTADFNNTTTDCS
ncbi:MAG TPA: hypothetical protein VN644_12220 [Pyrinomonadaceae bacterium]|nr:hypothetical protein [Pyrinomonadaceae bacterium]